MCFQASLAAGTCWHMLIPLCILKLVTIEQQRVAHENNFPCGNYIATTDILQLNLLQTESIHYDYGDHRLDELNYLILIQLQSNVRILQK